MPTLFVTPDPDLEDQQVIAAGEPLLKIQEQLRADRRPLEDPYCPTLTGEIRRALP